MNTSTTIITDERINSYFSSIQWSLPIYEVVRQNKVDLLEALYAQEITELVSNPLFERILTNTIPINPYERYVKPPVMH